MKGNQKKVCQELSKPKKIHP